MKKIYITVYSVIFIAFLTSCESRSNYDEVETTEFTIGCKYKTQESLIYAIEVAEHNSEGIKDNFYVIDDNEYFNTLLIKPLVIKSWQELKKVRSNRIKSPCLEKLRREDFSGHNFAVMLIPYVGAQYITNERFYDKDGCTVFAYDIRYNKGRFPRSAWIKLYVLKMKKL
jgi:hypothetical protein